MAKELLLDLRELWRFGPFKALIGWSSAGWAIVYATHERSWCAFGYGFAGGVLIGLSLVSRAKATP